jgi:hypothetical protein
MRTSRIGVCGGVTEASDYRLSDGWVRLCRLFLCNVTGDNECVRPRLERGSEVAAAPSK